MLVIQLRIVLYKHKHIGKTHFADQAQIDVPMERVSFTRKQCGSYCLTDALTRTSLAMKS